ncbi:MAG: hypothetical protein ACR2I1_06860, partial [Propionibacteriaceae bacterium]
MDPGQGLGRSAGGDVEAHILPTAKVREACQIPGTSARTAWLCRDKKKALRSADVPTAASAAVEHADQVWAFAKEFVEGMRAYTTRCPSTASRCTIRLALLPERAGGDLHRWISPQFISTNELESARSDSEQAAYGELRSLG